MKMALDNPSGVNTVRRYEPGRVTVRQQHIERSAIILPQALLTDWEPDSVADLSPAHLDPVMAHDIEVLILGTGESQVFPEPALLAPLMRAGIGFEIMDNAAACRTYNILLAEERRVALAILIAA
jgi:uncharacterized protein